MSLKTDSIIPVHAGQVMDLALRSAIQQTRYDPYPALSVTLLDRLTGMVLKADVASDLLRPHRPSLVCLSQDWDAAARSRNWFEARGGQQSHQTSLRTDFLG